MDLTDLYTPEELSEKKGTFLDRVLLFFDEVPDTVECAKIVSHKLHGTGGNLGLDSLSEKGAVLQRLLHENGDENQVQAKMQALKNEILTTLSEIHGESQNEL